VKIIDRFSEAWDGFRGRHREQVAMAQRGVWQGAQNSRLTLDWITMSQPSDQELIADLRSLRARSRDLSRNNGYATRIFALGEENVIGPTGIQMKGQIRNRKGDLDKDRNEILQDAWAEWCDVVSLDGRMGMVDFCQLAIGCLMQDGELFVQKHIGAEYPHGFALQLIDPELVDEQMNRPATTTRNEIRLGVEVDNTGRRVGYWVRPEPYSLWANNLNPRFISADQIIHIGRSRRINQTRFVPWLAPVMEAIKFLGGLEEAELISSRAAAAKGGVWTQKEGMNIGEKGRSGQSYTVPQEILPGSQTIGPPGYDFHTFDPQHPNTAFAAFHSKILRGIAAGVGISYTALANDPADANYSSSRSALQLERDFWKKIQYWWIRSFMQPVFDEWLKVAQLTDDLSLGLLAPDHMKLKRVLWVPRGYEWIDPKSDVEAAVLAIDNHLDSQSRILAARGLDEGVIIEQLAEHADMAKEFDLAPPPSQKPTPAPAPPADPKGKTPPPAGADTPPSEGGDPTATKPNGNGAGGDQNRVAALLDRR
jgi:lambda family phage portal protein